MYQISPSKQPNSLIVKIVDGDFFSNINLGRMGLYVRLSISCAAPSLHKQCGRNEAQRLISFLPFWKSLGKKTLRDFWNHTFTGKSHRIINYPNTFTVALHTVHSLARQSMAAFWGAWDTSLSSLVPHPHPPPSPSQRSLQPGRAVCAWAHAPRRLEKGASTVHCGWAQTSCSPQVCHDLHPLQDLGLPHCSPTLPSAPAQAQPFCRPAARSSPVAGGTRS